MVLLDATLPLSYETYELALTRLSLQGISRRPKGDKNAASAQSAAKSSGAGGGKPNIKKAAFDATRKKIVGVTDLTLISQVSNESINDNLKIRFEHGEIYVRPTINPPQAAAALRYRAMAGKAFADHRVDVHWTCAGIS